MKLLWLLVLAGLAPAVPALAAEDIVHSDVFVSGKDGYHGYRIPAIETAPDGSLLSFAEARKHNLGDPGMENNEIDLVMKRSADGGRTWSAMTVIEHAGERWSAANPATIVDRSNGRIWLHYLRCKPGRNTHTARPGTDDVQNLARSSDDNGVTWSAPTDLTSIARDMNDKQWRCSVVGPGGAIQDRNGRLVAAVWKFAPWGVFAIYSDDHGRTWRRGQPAPAHEGGDENQLVELADGRLLMDFRQQKGPHRWMSVSRDGGASWSEPRPGLAVTAVCCAIERYSLKASGDERNRILWTGPKGPGRAKLVIRVSYDEAETFPNERPISDQLAAYSDLTVLQDKTVGVLWERADYKFITFTRLTPSFLEPK